MGSQHILFDAQGNYFLLDFSSERRSLFALDPKYGMVRVYNVTQDGKTMLPMSNARDAIGRHVIFEHNDGRFVTAKVDGECPVSSPMDFLDNARPKDVYAPPTNDDNSDLIVVSHNFSRYFLRMVRHTDHHYYFLTPERHYLPYIGCYQTDGSVIQSRNLRDLIGKQAGFMLPNTQRRLTAKIADVIPIASIVSCGQDRFPIARAA
jgi:hypothetical protein